MINLVEITPFETKQSLIDKLNYNQREVSSELQSITDSIPEEAQPVQISTTERVDTGKRWIDGSVIYTKAVAVVGDSTNNIDAEFEAGPTPLVDISKFIHVMVFMSDGAANVYTDATPTFISVTVTDSGLVITPQASLDGFSGYVVLEYCLLEE